MPCKRLGRSMTYATRSLIHSRSFGFVSSLAIHIAVGIALLTTIHLGPDNDIAGGRHSERLTVMELRALEAGDSTMSVGQSPLRDAHRDDKDDRLLQVEAVSGSKRAAPQTGPSPSGPGDGASEQPVERQGAQTGTPSISASDLQSFRSLLLSHIERYRGYPDEARRASVEGVTHIHFVMDHSGAVLQIWIETSSGSSILDNAALAAVMRARPLPSPPPSWPASVFVTLPIGYSLQ